MKKPARPIQSDHRLHGVIVATQRDDGRWLMIRRSQHVPAPGKICFPGGAIELGESHRAAAAREVREELGITLTPERCVWHKRFSDKPLTLWGWLAPWQQQPLAPDPHEVAEALWLSTDEILNHADALPYTDVFIYALQRLPMTAGIES